MNTIKSIKTIDGEYQIDYNGLANLPEGQVSEVVSATEEFHPTIGGSGSFGCIAEITAATHTSATIPADMTISSDGYYLLEALIEIVGSNSSSSINLAITINGKGCILNTVTPNTSGAIYCAIQSLAQCKKDDIIAVDCGNNSTVTPKIRLQALRGIKLGNLA